jgi:hypothetical protein
MNRIMDLSAKPFGSLTLDEVVYLHVAGRLHESTSDFNETSSLEQILTSMRSANGRDNSKFYGPAMCAFAILDGLGTCYDRRSSRLPNKTTSIMERITYSMQNHPARDDDLHLSSRSNAIRDAAAEG